MAYQITLTLSASGIRVADRVTQVAASQPSSASRKAYIGALIGLLDPGATAIGAGGGLVATGLCPVEGGEQIARS